MAGEIEERLHELAKQIDRLRVLYEQHFLGMEKLPPNVARRETERMLAALGNQNIGNTALRFRYLGLVRRWKLHAERWDKIVREIENGTYKPHIILRERRNRQKPPQATPYEGRERREVPEQVAVPGMTDAELRALHQRYTEACRALGDRREVRFEALVASLQKQVPTILEKSHLAAVSFEVAVKDGRVILRAIPRRDGAPPKPPATPTALSAD